MSTYIKKGFFNILGSLILAVGIYNIHSIANVTEGGGLGLILLLNYWCSLSPAVSGLVINLICYGIGIRALGKSFLIYSLISTISFSVFYALLEQFPRIWPGIAQHPLTAAILGGIFIGIGAGFCVCNGGAPGGDDALAMTLSARFSVNIKWIYLVSDVLVLALSATYIPLKKLIFSFITVIISGQIIGYMQKLYSKSGTN